METTRITVREFKARIVKFQERIQAAGLDACLVHGNEADFANVRYLSEYWPTFEAAAVFVPVQGEAVLIIGPESETYAKGRTFLKHIRKMVEYREFAEPQYPGIKVADYREVAKLALGRRPLKKLGIASWAITTMPVFHSLQRDLPGVELVKADEVFAPLRYLKSKTELALMREAFAISEIAIEAILGEIKPGMTENQVIGIAQREIYRHGGEYEGHALYCFCGPRTNNAICRPSYRKIIKNEVIQLNIGARVGGYSSSVGLPISIGPLPPAKRRLVEFGLEAHRKTMTLMKAGRPAGELVREYENWVKAQGFGKYLLYGPCHGIGMMEVERPWIESTSTFALEENMTFQVDTFFTDKTYGLRWENGVRVTKTGVELLSERFLKTVVL